ncbi:AAA family ATPase [Actinosynnema sp. NPDC020468]|uniref:AAA family ATPase n=1 Tax=Actinosynnema sp. NPDC020468 TaxID=3154488 RepID=UPI00340E616B
MTDDPDRPVVDARSARGVQIGDHNTQHVHLTTAGSSAVVTAIRAEPGPEVFVGRAPDLERVAAVLAPGGRGPSTGVVQGMGGIGKTALVRRAAADAVGRGWFRGGAVFVDLHGYEPANRVRPGQVFAAVLRALDVQAEAIPSDAAQQPAAYHRHLDGLATRDERVLVVLDNAADLDQVRDLVPAPGVHRVLITSRDALPLPGATRVGLGLPPPAEAAELVRAVLDQRARDRGEPADPRPAAEVDAMAEVLRWCGRLPQAVVIAAGVLAEEPDLTVAELAADLADSRTRLTVLDDGTGGVPAAFLTSWQRLRARDPEAARLLCLVTIAPGPDVGLPSAAALLGADDTVTRVRLRVLTRAHLLLGGPRRWEFHDLVRLAVTRHAVDDLGIPEADLAAATDRLLDHYLRTTRAALRWMATVRSHAPPPTDNPFAGWDTASAWLDSERACLVAGVVVAGETARHRQAVDLATALTGYLSWRRHVADRVAVAEIADRSVRRLGDAPGTVRAIVNLGAALIEARRFREAVDNLDTARLAGRVLLDSLQVEGRVYDDLGLALHGMGDVEGAVVQHYFAIDLFREIGDRRGEAAARTNAGIALHDLGDHARAVDEHLAAVGIFRDLGDRLDEAMARGNLAIALHGFGARGDAIDVLLTVRASFAECGDRRGEAQTWRNLGVLFREAGWFGEAVRAFVAAAATFAKVGDRRTEARLWHELERLYAAAGRPDDARFAAERAALVTGITGSDEPVRGLDGWRIHTALEDEPG